MNKAEANKEAKKIYDKWNREKDRIEKEAKKEGKWNDTGLDSNNHLFEELNKKTKEQLQLLKTMVDDE